VATCLLAIVGLFVISDFPEETKFVTEPGRELGILLNYKTISETPLTTMFPGHGSFRSLKIGGFMYLGMIVGAYGYA
jgi:hypothetical protein